MVAAAAEASAAPAADGEEAKGLGDMDVDEFLSMGLGDEDADEGSDEEEEEVRMSGGGARVSPCGASAWYLRLITVDGVSYREISWVQTTRRAMWRCRRGTRRSTPPTVRMWLALQLSSIRHAYPLLEVSVRRRSTCVAP